MSINIIKNYAKVTPSKVEEEESIAAVDTEEQFSQRFVRLHNLLKMYGRQRHPQVGSYDELERTRQLVKWRYIPPKSTTIYISHEWLGTDHPDPDGTQMYHLLLMLERLQSGDINRTDMNAFHSLLYKQNHSTTAKEWKRVLDSEKTYIWYDGFCLPRSRQEVEFQLIPSYIKRCDFMIILTLSCTHFDRIDPRTNRKMNLCYRTYRLRARCVFELFCAFLTTRGGAKVTPALLVRSGTGIPNWVSPLECMKLAVGTSIFDCCETNHTTIKQCRRQVCLVILDRLIEKRARSLFANNNYAEARETISLRNYWCRGLIDENTQKHWSTLHEFKFHLRWRAPQDALLIDREGFPLLAFAASSDCPLVVQQTLAEIEKILDVKKRRFYIQGRIPKCGIVGLGMTGGCTALIYAMAASRPEIVSLLLKHGMLFSSMTFFPFTVSLHLPTFILSHFN
jgi:hypothetical protein